MKFIKKYNNILNWIPAIGILFFINQSKKYNQILMFVDEFIFWAIYQSVCVLLLIEIIKANVK